jgi:small subunit ribosomal protein S4
MDNKCKQCRRAGEKLMLKGERCYTPKCAIVKRNYAPGAGGPNKRRGKMSDYGTQLKEKQQAKIYYNLREKQFRLTFEKAKKQSGDAGKNFLKLLEMRLDNVVYRLGFAVSRQQARQLVNHGHFFLNGKKADIPSIIVKPEQVISIKPNKAKNNYFRNVVETVKKAERPSWLNFNADEMSGKVLHEPTDNDLPSSINVQMIIEFYSK